MPEFVIGERRAETRTHGPSLPGGYSLAAPGMRTVEIVDASISGVRLRTESALRPGHSITVRHRPDATRSELAMIAVVLRCSVYRLGRSGITFEAALRLLPPPTGKGGA